MSTLTSGGATLHYDSRGDGPAVILHHPLVADGRAWGMIGVPDALVAAGFRCVTFDAIGHGRSDPGQGERAGLAARIADVLAVAGAVGADHFHYVGYSMGGWVGTGLAASAPERLLSLFIAGWDPIDGARRFTGKKDTASRNAEFAGVIQSLTAQARSGPDVARVQGYLSTYERLFTDLPSIANLAAFDGPLMMAVGEKDPYCEPVQAACEALAVECLTLAGDHMTAFMDPAYPAAITRWITAQAR